MSEFIPKFPRMVAGTEWRAPLLHPEIESIAKRADHLYRNYSLSEEHRSLMLVQYARLVETDNLLDGLGKLVSEISLRNDPGIRPEKPVKGGNGGEVIDIAVGFALRLEGWVQRLEDHYGLTAWRKFGEVTARDEHGNPIVDHDDGEVYDAETGKVHVVPQPDDDII